MDKGMCHSGRHHFGTPPPFDFPDPPLGVPTQGQEGDPPHTTQGHLRGYSGVCCNTPELANILLQEDIQIPPPPSSSPPSSRPSKKSLLVKRKLITPTETPNILFSRETTTFSDL